MLTLALTLAPLLLTGLGLTLAARRRVMAGALFLGLVVTLLYERQRLAHWLPQVALSEQALLYALLALVFGRSLRAGEVPLCTRVATYVRGPLDREVECYTRRLTCAWSLFLGSVSLTCLVLLTLSPAPQWPVMTNVGGIGLTGLFFLIEHWFRRRALPHLEHTSMAATWRTTYRHLRPKRDDS